MIPYFSKRPIQKAMTAMERKRERNLLKTKIKKGILYSSILNFLYTTALVTSISRSSGIMGEITDNIPSRVSRVL
jgi:hypothetical protein